MRKRLKSFVALMLLICLCVPSAAALTVKVKTSRGTRVYSHPSSKASSLTVRKGFEMDAVAASNGWAKVRKNGNTAFIRVDDLIVNEPTLVRNVVGLALLQNGRPYGRSRGFDCSSLVIYCYGKYGYDIKSRAVYQAGDHRYKLITDINRLKPGDILCFDTEGFGVCDHVAIYMGGNRFINASQGADRVKIGTLNTWYRAHFMCARRVVA